YTSTDSPLTPTRCSSDLAGWYDLAPHAARHQLHAELMRFASRLTPQALAARSDSTADSTNSPPATPGRLKHVPIRDATVKGCYRHAHMLWRPLPMHVALRDH